MKHSAFMKRARSLPSLQLENGSRVAVIGGGPAGSFFSYFLLAMAKQVDLDISVDIFEPRDFNIPGPLGCNMCGGVLYESLVQNLAVEGINLPADVVQRGMEYNRLHLDSGSVTIHAARHEKRIAATFRGIGPRGLMETKGGSLDNYLLRAAIGRGARHIRSRVEAVGWGPSPNGSDPADRRVQIKTPRAPAQSYDLLAVASGVNTALLKQFRDMDFGYQPPETTKLVVREYFLGEEAVSKYFGPVFHAFLLDIPGLDYGAIIPKGDYVTICLLSSHQELHADAMDVFLDSPAVKRLLPPDFSPGNAACLCGPRINVRGSKQPYGDRIVFVGDCGVSRLYKDGIGAAYRAARIAAGTSIFQGISARDFEKHYLPFCREFERDNQVGKFLFKVARVIQKTQVGQEGIVRMISGEQNRDIVQGHSMSMVLWDMLTGGAPYREVMKHALHPLLLSRFFWLLIRSFAGQRGIHFGNGKSGLHTLQKISPQLEDSAMNIRGALGKIYRNGEVIIRQGDQGNSMCVIQDGNVEVIKEINGQEVTLGILGENDFFGEMAIFEKEVRTATVRALGIARILTIDSKNLLRRIHEDPSLAYRLVRVLSTRVRKLGEGYAYFSNDSFRRKHPEL